MFDGKPEGPAKVSAMTHSSPYLHYCVIFFLQQNRKESKGIESSDKKSTKEDKAGERRRKGQNLADKPIKLGNQGN